MSMRDLRDALGWMVDVYGAFWSGFAPSWASCPLSAMSTILTLQSSCPSCLHDLHMAARSATVHDVHILYVRSRQRLPRAVFWVDTNAGGLSVALEVGSHAH